MGRGIAYTAALSGFRVKLHDIDEAHLHQARASIETLLQKSADKGFIDRDQEETAMQQLSYENDLQAAVHEADVVIEAVLEEIPLKVEIFRKLDEYKALKLGLNHPMGPLELADLVGLDSRLRNMNYLYETLGENTGLVRCSSSMSKPAI